MKNFEVSVEPVDPRRFTPAPTPPPARPPRPPARTKRNAGLPLVAVLVFAVVAGLVTWFFTSRDDNSSKSNNAAIKVVSEQGLQKLVVTSGKPIYWVGPQQDVRYAVEERSNGQVYVRYLSAGMKADTIATLTVGTYPMRNAYASTLALGKKSGWKRLDTGTGGPAAFSSSKLTRNVYLAQSGLDYQIEIYDPTPGRAAELVQAGFALPVAQGERLGLTLEELRQKVASLSSPVYWLGSQPNVTYEYTRNPNGNVYLRYLPKGVALGASDAYPTVGTYPMPNAAATTRKAAGRAGSVPVKLTGAEAFYATSKPTSVYVAFTGSDYQIEVYDSVSARALSAVSSGQVKPVG